MTNEYISKQYAVNAINYALKRVFTEHVGEGIINPLKPADVVPYSISSDGTLTVTVPKGTKRIGRILIEEDGTQYGGHG